MLSNDPHELLPVIAKILDDLKIRYVITGGVAVTVWGRPRFTADIDTIIDLPEEKVDAFVSSFRALGETGYIEAPEIRNAIIKKGEFNFIDGRTGMKVDFWIAKPSVFDRSRLERRKPQEILGATVYFSSPEDVILSKLDWYAKSQSDRQLDDITSIIEFSGDVLDKEYLRVMAQHVGLAELLKKVLESQTV